MEENNLIKPQTPKTSFSPLIVMIIVGLLIAVSGIFIYSNQIKPAIAPTTPTRPLEENAPTATAPDQLLTNLKTVSTSDDVSAISQDLQQTNLQNINPELNNIQTEAAGI